MGHVGVAGEGAAARTHRGALVGRLDGHNQVGGVGHHHVRHLEDDNKIEHLTPTRRGLEPDPNYLNSDLQQIKSNRVRFQISNPRK